MLIQKGRDESIAVLGRHHGESEANQKVKKLSTFFVAGKLKGDMSEVIEERHRQHINDGVTGGTERNASINQEVLTFLIKCSGFAKSHGGNRATSAFKAFEVINNGEIENDYGRNDGAVDQGVG